MIRISIIMLAQLKENDNYVYVTLTNYIASSVAITLTGLCMCAS